MATKRVLPRQQSASAVPDDPALVDLARKINESHQAVLAAYRSGMEHALKVGALLNEAKEITRTKFGHGHWLPWVEKHCSFGKRTAQLYMQIAILIAEMPDLRDEVLKLDLNSAGTYLENRHKSRLAAQELEDNALSSAVNTALYHAGGAIVRPRGFEALRLMISSTWWNAEPADRLACRRLGCGPHSPLVG